MFWGLPEIWGIYFAQKLPILEYILGKKQSNSARVGQLRGKELAFAVKDRLECRGMWRQYGLLD